MATELELHDEVPAFPGMRVYCEWAPWLLVGAGSDLTQFVDRLLHGPAVNDQGGS